MIVDRTADATHEIPGTRAAYVGLIVLLNREGVDLGDGVAFNYGCYVNGAGGVKIGERTTFGPYCCIHSQNHGQEGRPIEIGADCWFGCGCIIVPGTTIGDGCKIGGGSVLTGAYPEGSVIHGERALSRC